MKIRFNPEKHHRRAIRLKHHDYASEGAYYVTIVTHGRHCLFGEIIDGKIHLNEYGRIVQKWWEEISVHFPNVNTGAFVIMPNHVHGIIFITIERRGEVVSPHNRTDQNNSFINEAKNNIHDPETSPLRQSTLGQIIAYFKYQSTKEMNGIETRNAITKFWQRNYYEHIIRNEMELEQKTNYILNNPTRWKEDQENPEHEKAPG